MAYHPIVEIDSRRAKTLKDKRERLNIKKLRLHPKFDPIVKKIVAGESILQITRWCRVTCAEEEIQNFTFETWRTYLTSLRKAIRVKLEENPVEREEPTPEVCHAIVDQVRQENEIRTEEPDFKPQGKLVWNSVLRAIQQLDSERELKVCFMLQMDRVEKLITKENLAGALDENGYKEILALKDIAAETRKFEVGEQVMRGGKSYAYGGQYSRKAPEAHVATSQAPAEATDSNTNSLVARVSRLDEIDRNLLIAASERIIDMIETEGTRARVASGGVEADSGTENSEGPGIAAGPVVEDESAGAPDIRDGNTA